MLLLLWTGQIVLSCHIFFVGQTNNDYQGLPHHHWTFESKQNSALKVHWQWTLASLRNSWLSISELYHEIEEFPQSLLLLHHWELSDAKYWQNNSSSDNVWKLIVCIQSCFTSRICQLTTALYVLQFKSGFLSPQFIPKTDIFFHHCISKELSSITTFYVLLILESSKPSWTLADI